MRRNPTKKIEKYRITEGRMASDSSFGATGAFVIPYVDVALRVVASDGSEWKEAGLTGTPWEHVSVSLPVRCPTWAEMDYVKRIFWKDDEVVMQLHVSRENHINHHPNCLHLWRPIDGSIPLPPQETVGPTGE